MVVSTIPLPQLGALFFEENPRSPSHAAIEMPGNTHDLSEVSRRWQESLMCCLLVHERGREPKTVPRQKVYCGEEGSWAQKKSPVEVSEKSLPKNYT